MKTRKKRLLSVLVCVAMLVAMVPMNVFAADETEGTHYEETIVLEGKTPNTNGQYEIKVPDLEYYEDSVTVTIKHTAKGHNCDDNFSYLGADEFKYMYIPAEPPFYPEAEEYSMTGLLFIARETANPIYVAFKIKDNYYSLYDGNTAAITKPFAVSANTNYSVDMQHSFLQNIFGTNYEMSDTASLDTLLDKVELVVFKDATFNSKIASYKWSDLIETTYDCPGHSRGYTFDMYYDAQNNLCISNLAADASIVYTVEGTEYAVGAQVEVNGKTVTIKKYDEATQTYTYIFDNSVFSGTDKVTLSYWASDAVVENSIVLDIDLEATHKTVTNTPSEDTNTGDKEDNTNTEDKENTSTADKENETTTTDKENETTTEIKDVTLTEANKAISKDDMAALITENATKDVVIKTPTGITLTFAKGTMKAVDGKDTYDFGVSISDDYSKQSNMGDVTKDNFVSLIDFEYSGNLPAEATIKIPVGADRAGQTLYYLQKVGTEYTLIQSAKVDNEGYITVKQDHCSTYVVATSDVSSNNTSDVNKETTTGVNEESSSTEQNEPKETKDSNNWFIYVIIVVVIMAIAGIAVFIVYKKKKTEQQNN